MTARRSSGRVTVDRATIVKPLDAWWTVLLVDPIAVRLVPMLADRRWVTPTRITWFAHVLGVASAVAFAFDALVVGAVLFEVRFVSDCIDGKLARATGQTSAFGRELDVTGDLVLVAANMGAIGLGHLDGGRGHAAMIVTLVGSYLVATYVHEARQRVLRESGTAAPVDGLVSRGPGRALARHRLYPMPTSVEAEHGLLFVLPVVAAFGPDLVAPGFVAGTAFYVAQTARYGVGLLRAAARVDDAAGP